MALVRQPKTAVFRPKCRYEYIGRRLSKCEVQKFLLILKSLYENADTLENNVCLTYLS